MLNSSAKISSPSKISPLLAKLVNPTVDPLVATKSTAYINLEPCCIESKTSPCTKLLIENGIKEVYISMLDAAGIDVACLNSIFFGDAQKGNDLVYRYVTERPDRFVGAAFVTPHYPEEMLKELDRSFDKLGMKFIKIYPIYNIPISSLKFY